MERSEFDIHIASMRDKLYRFACSILGCRDHAEDAVHDVMERIWRRREELTLTNPEAFAMRSVRNACLDHLRRNHGSEELTSTISAPSQSDDWSEREMVRRAIARLPVRQREAIHLKEIEGYPTNEIAQMLSTDQAQVRVLLSRGRQQLRKELEKIMNYGI